MTFKDMIRTYIEAFAEMATDPGQGLVNRNKIRLLENIHDTLGDKVLSVDTLLTAIKEVEVLSDYNRECVYVSDLINELEQRGINCKL